MTRNALVPEHQRPLLRDVVLISGMGFSLEPDTDEEAIALHELADAGFCTKTETGFIPTDLGISAIRESEDR